MILKTIVVSVLIALAAADDTPGESSDYIPTADDLADLSTFDLLYGTLCNCSTTDYEPLCGSNGKSFRSVCQFRCARQSDKYLSVTKIGLCSDFRACEAKYAHKGGCSENYRTQQTLKKLYRLNCRSCGCTKELRPVCASDNKNYANMCVFKCYALTHNSPMLLYPDKCEHSRIVNEGYALQVFKTLYDDDCKA